MDDFERNQTIAAQWRHDNDYTDKGGVIVIYRDQVQGWVNELRDPGSWRPDCIAVDSDGNQWVAVGGNEYDGAAEWQAVGINQEEPPIFIPKKLSDDPRYRECQAKEMAARRLERNRRA